MIIFYFFLRVPEKLRWWS